MFFYNTYGVELMAEEKENCTHDCSTCGVEGCESRGKIEKLKPHEGTSFQKIIAVISGKGGVGKSLVTSLLAVSLMNAGHSVALLDADVTGPSAARAFGVDDVGATGDENGIFPIETKRGMPLLGANNLLETPTTPIVWRGSLISNLVTQMFTDVCYGEKEVLLIDMPPGTGDVPLTVFQSLPISGAIVVATPQDLVNEVVAKSINMAKLMKVKLLGVVENMAYIECPHCGEKIRVFGQNNGDLTKATGVPVLDELPIDPKLTQLIDAGNIEEYKGDYLAHAVEAILKD